MDVMRLNVHARVGGNIYNQLKKNLLQILLSLLTVLRTVGRFVWRIFLRLEPVTRPLQAVVTRVFILPIYKIGIFAKLRFTHVVSSARGFFFFLLTNKFVLHAILLAISLSTVIAQTQTNAAIAADVGENSILYALVSQGKEETVQEEVHADLAVKSVSYLGTETIQAIPDIDFDYDGNAFADLTVPGSIAQQPGTNLPVSAGASEIPDIVVARNKTELYTVKSGDSVALIARRFGVTVSTIIQANQLTRQASIKPGDTLKIPPVSGVLHVVKKGDTISKLAKLYQADEDKIVSANQLPGQILTVGEEVVIPDGIPPVTVSRPSVALRPGVQPVKVPNKSYDTYQETNSIRVDVRPKPADVKVNETAVPRVKMIWPTAQRVVTQYYSLRHTGMDIDGDYTDPIYAVADGIVEKAGWNSAGYGLQIVINHQDGRTTRYAHASKLFVQEGDRVKKGQVIAMVGTTGRSTGTHLHFEVYLNGKRQNPLGYIK